MFQVAKNAKYSVNIKIKADNTTIPFSGCECWIVEMGGIRSWDAYWGQKYLPIVVFLAWLAWPTHFAMSQ